jgi:predicted N-acetyltransferase YhbS
MTGVVVLESRGAADLERVCELLHAAFSLHDGRIDPPSGAHHETIASLRKRLERETLLVAEAAGRIAGCIWCLPEAANVYIGRLAVHPDEHGRGIGRRLLEASIDWARARGAETMTLGVRVELVENIAFFERHGFAISEEHAHAGYDRPTNYTMTLRL